MPPVLVAVAYIAATYGATAIAVSVLGAGAAATIIGGVVGLFISVAVGGILIGNGAANLEERSRGLALNNFSGIESRKLVYGRVRLGGPIVYASTTDLAGDDNAFLHLVIPLAHTECTAIDDVFLGDRAITTRQLNGSGEVTAAPFFQASTTRKAFKYVIPGSPYQITVSSSVSTVVAVVNDNVNAFGIHHTLDFTDVSPAAPAATFQYQRSGSVFTFHSSAQGLTATINWYSDTSISLVRIRKHLGQPGQVADADLIAADANWTANHIGAQTCYLYMRLSWDDQEFRTGRPVVTAVVKGRKLYDPRDAQTRYSNNAALAARDWLIHTQGFGAASAEIDDASVIAAANICDERVTMAAYPVVATADAAKDQLTLAVDDGRLGDGDGVRFTTTGTLPVPLAINTTYYLVKRDQADVALATTYANSLAGTIIDLTSAGTGVHTLNHWDQARYTVNGVVDSADSARTTLENLLQAMAGFAVWQQGKFRIYAGAYSAPALTLDESDLRGGYEVVASTDRKSVFNAVRGLYANPARDYLPEDYPPYVNSTYATQDGETIFHDLSFAMVTNATRAQRLAKIALESARQEIAVTLACNLHAAAVEVGSRINLSLAQMGWAPKVFFVIRYAVAEDGGIDLTLREDAAAVYNWAAGEQTNFDLALNTTLPDPRSVAMPTGLSAASGEAHLVLANDGSLISRISVSWNRSTDSYVLAGGDHQVQFKKSSDAVWSDAHGVPGDESGTYLWPVQDGVDYDIRIRARNALNVASAFAEVANHTVVGKSAPPSNVSNFSATFDGPATVLHWSHVSNVDRADYEVRLGATWASAVLVGRTRADFLRIEAIAAAATFIIKAFDTSGNESVTAASVAVTPVAPGQVAPSALFDLGDVKLTWAVPGGGSYPVARYEVRYGATFAGGTSVGFVDVTTFRALANWSGSRTWWVQAIDAGGALSTPGSVEVIVNKPSAPAITSQVIDNNVLLSWTDATQTLPIKFYEIRRGTTFSSATVVGTVQARFSVIFESSAGLYKYWVVGVDSAGNYGTEQSVSVTVSAPPDFILYIQTQSTFAGTKTNCYVQPLDGKLLACVNTTETFADHFVNHSWSSMQDQVNAGYPLYIEPSSTTGQYSETLDYGTVIPSTLISVSMGSTVVAGTVTVTPTISTKKLVGDAWTDHPGVWQFYATDFQFVKVTLDFAATGGTNLLLIDSLVTRLDVKIKKDGGTITANAGDSGGTTVNFNVAFIDVRAITGTPQGTVAATAVIDFTRIPNPTSFKVLVFDLSGTRITRDFRWEASGA